MKQFYIAAPFVAIGLLCEALMPNGLTSHLLILMALGLLATLAYTTSPVDEEAEKEAPQFEPSQIIDLAPIAEKLDRQAEGISLLQQTLSTIIRKTKLDQIP